MACHQHTTLSQVRALRGKSGSEGLLLPGGVASTWARVSTANPGSTWEVGNVVQHTCLSPQHVQGAPKLVLKDVWGLLKAKRRDILAHGLSPAHSVKSGGHS
jgi:hypothetical protein